MNGHELARKILDSSLPLKQYRTPEAYEYIIYNKVSKELPHVIYNDIYEVLKELHDILMQ